MPILLCLAALPLLFALFWKSGDGEGRRTRGWEESFLLAAVSWAALAAALAEILSLFDSLRPAPALAGWALVDAVLLAAVWSAWRARRRRVSFSRPKFTALDLFLMATLGLYLAALAAVAASSPPNNVDSLQYHMARVVHWAQQGSLDHYGAGYGYQLFSPPGAEILILHFRLLTGGDRLANFIQWLAYLGSLVGVWWIAGSFGLGRSGRWVAVGFAAGIPMAVLQATSTQNDLVTAVWLLTMAGLILNTRGQRLTAVEVLALGLVLGVGLLTKATFYLLSTPLVVWMTLSRPWRSSPWRSLGDVVLVGVLAAAMNLGPTMRHLRAGWSPVGPVEIIRAQTSPISAAGVLGALTLHPVHAGLLNFATPSTTLNENLVEAVSTLGSIFGFEGDRPVLMWGWNHEVIAGSPLQVLLVLISGACLIFQRRWPRAPLVYAGCLAAGFVLMTAVIRTTVDPANIRYQLPTVVAWSPLVGLVASRNFRPRLVAAFSLLLVVLAIPWILFNKGRPIIPMQPDPGAGELPCLAGCTAIGSVFTAPEDDILFAYVRDVQENYTGVAQSLRSKSCRQVGLRIESYAPEYALWHLLEAPQSGFRLETIYTAADLAPLLDRSFRPCAIICTICGGRERLHGLDLYSGWGDVRLYLGDGFTWDENG